MYHLPYSLYQLFWLFLIYSLLGWCAGVAVAAVKRKKFINTGVLNLPFCPVYGFSALAYTIFLADLREAPIFLFIGGMVISSCLTVLTGLVLKRCFHRKWWDYSKFRIGFDGYLTIPLLLTFGTFAVLVLWVGNGILLELVRWIPHRIGDILLLVLGIMLLLDLAEVLAVTWKWRRQMQRLAGVADNMQKVTETFGNFITRAVRRRLERSYPNLKEDKIPQAEAGKAVDRRFAEGIDFYKLFWLFLIGSLVGDIVETVFCRITMGWWMSRSSLVYGRLSVVWGFACALLTLFLYRHRQKSDGYIFIYGTVVGGTYEYICSVLAELVFGASFWDYSGIPFNLGGRINLLYCFFWGIAAVVWLKLLYPFLSRWIEKIPKKIGPALTWALAVLLVIDMGISALALSRYSARQRGWEPSGSIGQMLDEHFDDERMERIYPKAKIVE